MKQVQNDVKHHFRIIYHESVSDNYSVDILKDNETERKFLIVKDNLSGSIAVCPLYKPYQE